MFQITKSRYKVKLPGFSLMPRRQLQLSSVPADDDIFSGELGKSADASADEFINDTDPEELVIFWQNVKK
jgi:hypothetical protein